MKVGGKRFKPRRMKTMSMNHLLAEIFSQTNVNQTNLTREIALNLRALHAASGLGRLAQIYTD